MSGPHPAPPPSPVILKGVFCQLEPLTTAHAPDLFAAVRGLQNDARHQYLLEFPPKSEQEMAAWIAQVNTKPDIMFFALIDKKTGKCGGRQALMRIRAEHGSIEIGSILWGQGIAKTALGTEALYLIAKHIFEDLGYRRFEWKCNNHNAPSKKAALRFGFKFEGIFRNDLILKNANRDTAWFSMLDYEWKDLKPIYQNWLASENFDGDGKQKSSLATPRQPRPVQY